MAAIWRREMSFGSASGNVGRFIPDNFAVSLNTPVFATACSAGAFSYVVSAICLYGCARHYGHCARARRIDDAELHRLAISIDQLVVDQPRVYGHACKSRVESKCAACHGCRPGDR